MHARVSGDCDIDTLGDVEHKKRKLRNTRHMSCLSSALHLSECLYHSTETQASILYCFYKIFIKDFARA